MIVSGVDVGSTTTKAVIVDENKRMLGKSIGPTGANVVRAAERAVQGALKNAGLEEWDISYTVGTGYGRYKVPFGDAQITEIACHSKGACHFFPGTRTIVDIGGQDTKAIKVTPEGEVQDFCMNDKCAAGTGRFLEAAALTMGIPLEEIGPISLRASGEIKITNMCTVFVESEIMSHLARGRKVEDVLAAVHFSIASRSVALLRRVGIEEEITFTGGVSRNEGMIHALEKRLGLKINVCEDSQFTGALGAALFALEKELRKTAVG
jgi:predicted CoA-substrate-specific enzyme activase